jgi:hypothetical protein
MPKPKVKVSRSRVVIARVAGTVSSSGGDGLLEWSVHPPEHPTPGELGKEPVDRLVEPDQPLGHNRKRGRRRDGLGRRRDPEDRVAGHGPAANGKAAERLDVHLIAPSHERHEARYAHTADVLLGRGMQPLDSRARQTLRHRGCFSLSRSVGCWRIGVRLGRLALPRISQARRRERYMDRAGRRALGGRLLSVRARVVTVAVRCRVRSGLVQRVSTSKARSLRCCLGARSPGCRPQRAVRRPRTLVLRWTYRRSCRPAGYWPGPRYHRARCTTSVNGLRLGLRIGFSGRSGG